MDTKKIDKIREETEIQIKAIIENFNRQLNLEAEIKEIIIKETTRWSGIFWCAVTLEIPYFDSYFEKEETEEK